MSLLVPYYILIIICICHALLSLIGCLLCDQVNLKDLKVYYMENDGGIPVTTPVDKESRAAFNKVGCFFYFVLQICM